MDTGSPKRICAKYVAPSMYWATQQEFEPAVFGLRARCPWPLDDDSVAPLAGIEPASTLLNRQPRAPCSPEGNEDWLADRSCAPSGGPPSLKLRRTTFAAAQRRLVEHRGNAPRRTCLQGMPAPLCVPHWRSELVSSQPLRVFGAALSPDQLSERIGADGGNRTRATSVASRPSAIELHPRFATARLR